MAHRLLHVEASPRRGDSTSTALAGHFIETLRAAEPGLVVDRLDLWSEPLPDLDGPLLSAKYAVLAGRDLESVEAQAWRKVARLVERLRATDSVLVSTPMWNFGIPYRLKHWIDLVTQPGLSFAFDPASGYRPLLAPRPVTVVLSSAGDYSQGPSWGRPDLASPYLHEALRFIGLGTPDVVLAGPTAGDAAARAAAQAAARHRISDLLETRRRAA